MMMLQTDNKDFTDILDRTYRWDWLSLLKFEFSGKLGSIFYSKKAPILKSDRQLLHLGCGGNYLQGFVNADYYFLRWLPWRDRSQYDWLLDFRKPMKCPDNHWDGVFSEHTIEHLQPSECLILFKELYRTMKLGAIVRICVPGLDETLEAFSSELSNQGIKFRSKYKIISRAHAVFHLTQNNFHLSVWDIELFKSMLESVGFRDVIKRSFNEGADKELLKDLPEREVGSMYIEAVK
jgi:predicted SAM-dependent methyltransferase